MKTSREFNRKYMKHGFYLEYMGYGLYRTVNVKTWKLSRFDENGVYIGAENVHSIDEAVKIATTYMNMR